MQKANRILLLTITVLIFTNKTSDSSNSSYITCYSCQFESTNSTDIPSSHVCYNPKCAPTCVGLRCTQIFITCSGTDEECKGSPKIKVDRGCTNETDVNAGVKNECKTPSHPPGNIKSSTCICATEKCNGGEKTSEPVSCGKVVSIIKSVSSVLLVTMVFAPHFVSSMIFK